MRARKEEGKLKERQNCWIAKRLRATIMVELIRAFRSGQVSCETGAAILSGETRGSKMEDSLPVLMTHASECDSCKRAIGIAWEYSYKKASAEDMQKVNEVDPLIRRLRTLAQLS